jgi:hypothetical protein
VVKTQNIVRKFFCLFCISLFLSAEVAVAQSYLPVLVGQKYAFYDSNGTQIIGPSFSAAQRFSEGLSAVSLHEPGDLKWSYMSSSLSIKIKKFFTDARPFSDSAARIFNGSSWNFINHEGSFITRSNFQEANDFVDGFARVKLGGKWGIINKQGQFVNGPMYTECSDVKYGVFAAYNSKADHWAFLTIGSDTAIRKVYDDAGGFGDSLAPVKLKGKWGYIDLKGNTVIPFIYEEAVSFSEGLACVKKDGQWYFINRRGMQALPVKQEKAAFFRDGIAEIFLPNNVEAYLTRGGKTILKVQQ